MGSTFFGLDIAQSGMQAYQTALNTTAHNIANAGTKGYSKQTVVSQASKPLRAFSTYGMIGTGVAVTDITRQRSDYYDRKYQIGSATAAEYSTKSYYLNCIGSYIYAKDSDVAAITNSFDNFFAKLTNAESDTTSSTFRQEVSQYGETFATNIQETANNLKKLQDEANSEVKICVDQVNSLAERIVSLTKQINTLEVYGPTANDLRDQRSSLVDELSQYANVETKETVPSNGLKHNQYQVFLNGEMLVDTIKANKLVLSQTTGKDNINDVTGLYEVMWDNGQTFNCHSTSLGGKLQAIFQVRDGNNGENLAGKLSNVHENTSTGRTEVTLSDTNVNSTANLNIPSSDGVITIDGFKYQYDSFNVSVKSDGTYSYTFTLKDNISVEQKGVLNNAFTNGSSAKIGDAMDYKGVPYYMAQLNQFVRTFSEKFNKIHNQGFDANGKQGVDFLNMTQATDGSNVNFVENGAGNDQPFTSSPTLDADGNYVGSYYHMTCLNFSINKEVLEKPSMLAFSSDPESGSAENGNLQKLVALKDDAKMFAHGGAGSFIQALTSSVGVDGKTATSLAKGQDNILKAIDNRRLSLSGVDKDEEGSDLVKFQNLLFNQYKVLSVMNLVFDKLINGTGV